MITCMQIELCIWIIGCFSFVYSIPFIDPTSLEIQDELYDMEVYKAVVNSMNEWQRKHDFKKTKNRTKREDPSVCYADLGCFEASGPFGYLDMLPSKPEEINTRFLMYPTRTRRRRSGSTPAEIPFAKMVDAFEWAKNGFNKSLPTKVLIHGFGSDCGYIWAYEIRSALMAVEEVNTICVDWSNGASLPNYIKASANTRLVGKQLSLLLRGLVEKNGLSLQMTHLIGFSLGAHIAGFAGADLGNLSRITGLDPAGPLFESQDTRARLDQTDATFVDVIHSNGENLILGGLGTSQPMGHVDFYPNGGRMQKGCSHLFVGAVSDIIWSSAIEGRSLCNHRRAYKFFIDSVSPRCHFPAFPCDSYTDFLSGECFPCTDDRKCGNMGYYADKSKGRGQLYLITRDEEPFCAHQYLVKIESAPSGGPIPVKNYGKIKITLIGDSFLNETFMMTGKEDEEMKLGESISKILVPHPILSTPSRIEILYTAYSGWLSSGLTEWKVENVTLTDSFGEMLSTCNQSLALQSGVPVILSLYPGNCSIDSVPPKEAEDRMEEAENKYPSFVQDKKEFIPTQVIKIGLKGESSEETGEDSWNRKESNFLTDNEPESSRTFNSKADKLNKNQSGLIKEVVEPILKLQQSSKNGRSHEPNKTQINNVEITEPILGPTTIKTNTNGTVSSYQERAKLIEKENVLEDMRRRVNESKSFPRHFTFTSDDKSQSNPLDSIVTTVQLIPQRLARMFEQAESFARENILPLVSTYTPRIISDFIGPKDDQQQPQTQYIPLNYKDEARSMKSDIILEPLTVIPTQLPLNSKEEISKSSSSSSEVIVNLPTFKIDSVATNSNNNNNDDDTADSLIASSSHIQKISKKKNSEKIQYIFPRSESSSTSSSTTQMTPFIGMKNTESTTTLTTTSSIIKNTNTFTFNRANSSFTIEYDTPAKNSKTTKRQEKSLQNNRRPFNYNRNNNNNNNNSSSNNNNFTPIVSFVNAMQKLPDQFAKMLSQAQDYTRRNILPFMENYTPRQLTDLIWIRHRPNVTLNVNKENNQRSGNLEEEKVNVTISIDMNDQSTGSTTTSSTTTISTSPSSTFESNSEIPTSIQLEPPITTPIPSSTSTIPTGTTIKTTTPSLIAKYLQRLLSTVTSARSLVPPIKLIPIGTTPASTVLPSTTPATPSASPSVMPAGRKAISFFFPRTFSDASTDQSTEVQMILSSTPVPVLLYDVAKTVFGLKYVIGSTSTPKVMKQRLLSENEYIQRIPRKGEKLEYVTPFTVVIDANDLTTTSSTTTSTSTTTTRKPFIKKPYLSYVQKIPKKGSSEKKQIVVLPPKMHPMLRNTKAEKVNLYAKDQYGDGDMTYHITSDGRFEV